MYFLAQLREEKGNNRNEHGLQTFKKNTFCSKFSHLSAKIASKNQAKARQLFAAQKQAVSLTEASSGR